MLFVVYSKNICDFFIGSIKLYIYDWSPSNLNINEMICSHFLLPFKFSIILIAWFFNMK
jgi:hypothetical protein